METNIQSYVTASAEVQWQPLVEKNIHYEGVFVKSLRFDPDQQRSTTILLKFEPGASYPYHNHPAGEELFVMEGVAEIEGAHLKAGDYLYTPAGCKHSVRTAAGCTLLLIVPEEVEIIRQIDD